MYGYGSVWLCRRFLLVGLDALSRAVCRIDVVFQRHNMGLLVLGSIAWGTTLVGPAFEMYDDTRG